MATQTLGQLVTEFVVKGDDKLASATAAAKTGMTGVAAAATQATAASEKASGGIGGAFSAIGAKAKGLAGSVGGIGGMIGSALGGIGGLATGVVGVVGGVIGKLKGLSTAALGVFAAVSAGVGGLVSKGLANTAELDHLNRSFDMLARVVADQFAPAIRAASDGVRAVARWIRGLDAAAQGNLKTWAAVALGVTAVVALLPVATAAFGALAAAVTFLVSPIGLVVVALGAIGAAFVAAATKGQTWEERSVSIVAGLITGWEMAKAAVTGAATAIGAVVGGLWDGLVSFAEWVMTNWPSSWEEAWTLAKEVFKHGVGWILDINYSMMRTIGKTFEGLIKTAADLGKSLIDAIKTGDFKFDLGASLKQNFAGAFELVEAPKPDWLKSKWKPGVQSLNEFLGESWKGIKDGWNEASNGIKGALAGHEANKQRAKEIIDTLKGIGKGGNLNAKLEVKFESLQSTWDRLQQSLAADPSREREEAMLMELKQANNNGKQILDGILGLKDKLAVGFQ